MKKILIFSFALITPLLFAQDQPQPRYGLSIGFTSIENEFLSTGDDGLTRTFDTDFTALTYGFDVNVGKHGFNLQLQGSDAENSDIGGTYFSQAGRAAIGDSRDLDFDDFSVGYSYRFNSNWIASIGYNSTTTDYTYTNIIPRTGYQWDRADSGEIERTGFTLLAGYNTPLSNNLFFTAKIGYIQADLDETSSGQDVISGIEGSFSYINGDGFNISETYEGDSTAGVFGVGLVWLAAPKHQIRFDITVRALDYSNVSGTYNESPIQADGYFSQGYGDYSSQSDVTDEITDDFYFTSVSWRYALN